jgi:hypothetical protein
MATSVAVGMPNCGRKQTNAGNSLLPVEIESEVKYALVITTLMHRGSSHVLLTCHT